MTTLLLIALLSGPSDLVIGNDVTAGGTTSASQLTSSGGVEGTSLAPSAIASDAAPAPLILRSQAIWTAPGATNVNGAVVVVAPSPSENTLDGVTYATSTGKTLTFTVCAAGVCTTTVKTEGAASPDGWDCDGSGSDIACVCNLYDLLVGAGAITGVTVTRTDGTCSNEKLTFTIVAGTSDYLYVATNDDAKLDMTHGTDGAIWLQSGGIGSGYVYMGTPDRGVRFDTTSDGVLALTNENGSYLKLYLSNDLIFTNGAVVKQNTATHSFVLGNNSATSGVGNTGSMTITTPSSSNAGNYSTGGIDLTTGSTTNTDGDTGDITLTTGAAVAGAVDAGDFIVKTHGTQQQLKAWGAGYGVQLPVLSSADPSAGPGYSCDADHVATVVYVQDTDDNTWPSVCICAYNENAGGTYDWLDIGGVPAGTACAEM